MLRETPVHSEHLGGSQSVAGRMMPRMICTCGAQKAVPTSIIVLGTAFGLSLRDLKEMMAERGISVDHSTIHRWVIHFSAVLLKRFSYRKRSIGNKWHMDETRIKVRGQWMYLHQAIDGVGDTV